MDVLQTTVYKYGIGRPPRGESRALALDAMRESHRLGNRLVQLEQARREAIRLIQSRHPVIGPLTKEYDRQRALKDALNLEIASKHQHELDTVNAKIADAASEKPRRSTADLVKSRDALKRQLKKEKSKATEHIRVRMSEPAEELRQAKVLHKDELVPPYNEVTAQVKSFQKAAVNEQTSEEAAEFGFDAHPEGHVYTRWFTLDNKNDSFKARVSNMSRDNDPQFRNYRPRYLTNQIREGTLCAGINQTKANSAGPLAAMNNPNKGKLCILQPPPAAAYDPRTPRSQRRRLQCTNVKFRIGNQKGPNGGRQIPLWVELEDVIFHREVPANAIIVEALLKLEATGTREQWFLILTLQMSKAAPIAPKTMAAVAIQQNMHVFEGNLQYAELVTAESSIALTLNTNPRSKVRRFRRFGPKADGTRGWSGFKRDPEDKSPPGVPKKLRRFLNGELLRGDRHIRSIYDYQEEICGKNDAHFNLLILGDTGKEDEHAFCVMDYIQGEGQLPKPLRDAKTENVHKWRSKSKFQKLYRAWRENRVAGDEAAFDLMYLWAYQDLHLHQWARDMTARAIRRKENEFRIQANDICRRFSRIYIDDRPQAEGRSGRAQAGSQEHHLRLVVNNDAAAAKIKKWLGRASFGTFREILKKTASRLGVVIEDFNPMDTPAAQLVGAREAAE